MNLTFPFHQKFLPMRADKCFGKEGGKINHDFPQQWTHWSKRHLEFLSERRFTWRRGYSQMLYKRFDGQLIRSGLSRSRTQAIRDSNHRDLSYWLLSSLHTPTTTLHVALNINHTPWNTKQSCLNNTKHTRHKILTIITSTQTTNICHILYINIINFTMPSQRHTTSKFCLENIYIKWGVLKLLKAPFHLFQQFTIKVSHHQHNSRLQHTKLLIWTMHACCLCDWLPMSHVRTAKDGKLIIIVISKHKYCGMSSGVRQCTLQRINHSTQNHIQKTLILQLWCYCLHPVAVTNNNRV